MSERRTSRQRRKLHLVSAVLSAAAILVLVGDKFLPLHYLPTAVLGKEVFLYLALLIAIAAIFVGTTAIEQQRHWEKKERKITLLAMLVAVAIAATAIILLGSRACAGMANIY